MQSPSLATTSAPSASSGGALNVVVNASAQAGFGVFLVNFRISLSDANYRADLQDGYAGQAGAQANLGFQDKLTVSGPAGQPVEVRYTAVLDYTYSENGSPSGIILHQISDYADIGGTALPGAGSTILTLTAGTTYNLSAGETAMLTTDCGFCLPVPADPTLPDLAELTAELNGDHSTHFYFDPLTPGTTVVAQSGNDYSTPEIVPEPKTVVILGSALLFLSVFSAGRWGTGALQ